MTYWLQSNGSPPLQRRQAFPPAHAIGFFGRRTIGPNDGHIAVGVAADRTAVIAQEGQGEFVLDFGSTYSSIDLSAFAGMQPVEMLGYVPFPQITDQLYPLTLAPYSFFWLELQPAPEADTSSNATMEEPTLDQLTPGAESRPTNPI